MYSLVYVSTAAKLFDAIELDQILKESRAWNKQVDITGLLLYKEGNFMQFLEGPKEAVLEILGKIKTDPRHHSMMIIFQEEHRLREFSTWTMGFERIGPGEGVPPGFNDLWELPFSSEEFLLNPTRALQFLLSFKQSVKSTGSDIALRAA